MKKRSYNKGKTQHTGVQYKHDLGQHFLYDNALLESLVQTTGVSTADVVLEIGAGAGTLTRALCLTGARVVAVEVDDAMMPQLHLLSQQFDNLTVIQSDIRKLDLSTLELGERFQVVANIPYSITSQIFDLFWGKQHPVSQMSVMVQKEVADKLAATPGDKAFGLMSVLCRYYCIPEILAQVPAAAFTPPPKVDSAFVRLQFRSFPPAPVLDEALLFRIIKASFRMRRKTLLNALKTVVSLPPQTLGDCIAAISQPLTVRGEALSIVQWIEIANALALRIRSCSASAAR